NTGVVAVFNPPLPLKSHIYLSYLQHFGVSSQKGNFSYYILEMDANMENCSFGLYFTKTVMLKVEKIDDTFTGLLTFDANIIRQTEKVFQKCLNHSVYYGKDIHEVYQTLLEEAE
ncbi:MAG: hypothetical protein Q4E53_10530, partial [Eubacteriales bacterium]|nr:hypothetical protein [Eubacteriales bacterium]